MRRVPILAVLALFLLGAQGLSSEEFQDAVARVDEALRNNLQRAPYEVLQSCQARRNMAVDLYESGHRARAERSLKFCLSNLRLPRVKEAPEPVGPTMKELQARAAREIERATGLPPDLANGLEIYRECALCHGAEGWGLGNGSVPQLAGQHRTVVVKQLADIRAGNRDAMLMIPYASSKRIGGPQAIADVAGYIDTLEISAGGSKGPGRDLEMGARLYAEHCASCHGASGEGDAAAAVPRIQAQQFRYLVRQFEWIRDGKRRNANAEMVTQISNFDEREVRAILDHVSRLDPPRELRAPEGWRNPDFSE